MLAVYGIPNCDSVKKARAWLEARGHPYTFHDYKKMGVPEAQLRAWVAAKGWEIILNRKGTTWRSLGPDTQALAVDAESAIALMLASPSLIKRPIITGSDWLLVGWNAEALAAQGLDSAK